MDNLALYEALRSVPETAKKTITGGRLNGKTDINPMWRLKALTEQFGPCGIGWRYEITDKHLEPGADGEVAAIVDINLHIKVGEAWSEAIPGTGGSMFVAKERGGLYTSDECYKMALTDAISVACKALGVGADVYWEKDRTKYTKRPEAPQNTTPTAPKLPPHCEQCGKDIADEKGESGALIPADKVAFIRYKRYGMALCTTCAASREEVAGSDGTPL